MAAFDQTLYAYSPTELVRILGQRVRDYRMRSNMTIKDMSEKTGISQVSLQKFETGQSINVSMVTFIQVLKAIGRINALDELLPELPPSLYGQTEKGTTQYLYPENNADIPTNIAYKNKK